MADPRFDALGRRHRECLRLVYDQMRSKEIAADLGISPSTVDSYITEAVRILGARDRRDAARQLRDYEALIDPKKLRPQSPGVETQPVEPAPIEPPGEATDWRSYLPLRRKGARHNDLTIARRMAWIVGLALMMLMAFGQLTSGLKVAGDLIGARGDQ